MTTKLKKFYKILEYLMKICKLFCFLEFLLHNIYEEESI